MSENKIRGPDQRRELRAVSDGFAVREDGGARYLEGHFAVFNSDYESWDGMTESIAPGAFSGSLSGDIRALINHDTTLVLGRTKAGTLELREDSRGLWGRVTLNQEDTDAMNLYARVKRGDVGGCSIGFNITKEEHTVRADGGDHWTILAVDLHEVSVCTFPAYTETNISARCADREAVREEARRAAEQRKNNLLRRLKGNGAQNADAETAAGRRTH